MPGESQFVTYRVLVMALINHLPAGARARIRPLFDRIPEPVRRRIHTAPEQRPPFRRLLDQVMSQELSGVGQPVVMLIGGKQSAELESWIKSRIPGARIHRASASLSDADLHVTLAADGPYDLIIDDNNNPARVLRIRNTVFHARPGGVVLVRRLRGRRDTPAVRSALGKDLQELLSDIAGQWIGGKPSPVELSDRKRFGSAVRHIALRDGHLMLVAHHNAQAKIREEQVSALLRARPDLGEVILERPGGAVTGHQVRMSEYDHVAVDIPVEWEAPSMMLRRYNGVVTTPGQIVTAGPLILPETYRHLSAKRLRHEYVADVSADFAETTKLPWFASEPPPDGPRYLEGAYFYLDDEFRGHFGHMTTEVVSRLWAWDAAKAVEPSLRAIMHLNKHRELASWEVELLGAAGISRDEIVFTRDPVRVERLLSATPLFVNPTWVHPDVATTWRKIGDNLVRQAVGGGAGDRIFVSRRIEKRPCRNLDEVEQFFSNLGFEIVFPEDHSLGDQIQIFRNASIIAGFAGSGMFNLMFVPEPKQVLLVSSESYSGRNELLIAGVLGHKVAIAWCRSEAAWNGEAYYKAPGRPRAIHAGFTFDPDREGVFIKEIVADSVG